MSEKRILVVDDNPANLKLITYVLTRAGYEVRGSPDAAQAQTALATFVPNVILLDIQMPGMDGLTFAGRLKADPLTAAIPIVAVTAYAMKGDEERAYAAGFDGYVTKPIDTRTLAETVARFISRSNVSKLPAT